MRGEVGWLAAVRGAFVQPRTQESAPLLPEPSVMGRKGFRGNFKKYAELDRFPTQNIPIDLFDLFQPFPVLLHFWVSLKRLRWPIVVSE